MCSLRFLVANLRRDGVAAEDDVIVAREPAHDQLAVNRTQMNQLVRFLDLFLLGGDVFAFLARHAREQIAQLRLLARVAAASGPSRGRKAGMRLCNP